MPHYWHSYALGTRLQCRKAGHSNTHKIVNVSIFMWLEWQTHKTHGLQLTKLYNYVFHTEVKTDISCSEEEGNDRGKEL
jgi:hypothetical protein